MEIVLKVLNIDYESLPIVLIIDQLRNLVENFYNMSLKEYLDPFICFFQWRIVFGMHQETLNVVKTKLVLKMYSVTVRKQSAFKKTSWQQIRSHEVIISK